MSKTIRTVIVWAMTTFRLVSVPIVIWEAMAGQWQVIFMVASLAFISDFLDGWLARRWNVSSDLGSLLDPLADKAICLTLLALLAVYWSPWYWLLFAVFVLYDLGTTLLRLVLPRPMPASKIAKSKTLFLMAGIVGCLAAVSWANMGLLITSSCLLCIAAMLAGVSLISYIRALGTATWLELDKSVAQLDFAAWHKEYGITTMLFDIEGTLTQWADPNVDPAVKDALARAKKHGISHFGLVSNIHRRHAERVEKVARQIGAKTYHMPLSRQDRKPSPAMLKKALRALDASPEQTGFAGDKIVDVLAAYRAGVKRVAWVPRLGTADHPFDRWVYRPLESMLRFIVRAMRES